METILFRLHEDENGPQLIGQLILLSIAIKEAIQLHQVEEVFLQKRFHEIDNLIVACMSSSVMDEYDKFITMMCLNPFRSKGLPPDAPLIKKKPNSDLYELTSDAKITIFSTGPLNLCMKYDLSALCGTVQVATVSSVAFWEHLKHDFNHKFLEYFSLKSIQYEGILDMRSRPIFMFFLEGLSKCFLLFLCAYITIHQYRHTEISMSHVNNSSGSSSSGDVIFASSNTTSYLTSEILLVVMVGTNILYEIGQLQDMAWNYVEYFHHSVWNQLDWVSILLILLWVITRFIFHSYSLLGKGALCLAAIPSSLNLLRYLSVHRSSGVLVIMIMRVLFDLRYPPLFPHLHLPPPPYLLSPPPLPTATS
jgi:hypothetical protein